MCNNQGARCIPLPIIAASPISRYSGQSTTGLPIAADHRITLAGFDMSSMHDPANPTHEEIRRWAFDPNAVDPLGQDWDLVVSSPEYAELILSLAADDNCPNCDYFLNCLYILIGDTVRPNEHTMRAEELQALFNQANETGNPHLQRWVARSRSLLRDPASFDYNTWCSGGWAIEEAS